MDKPHRRTTKCSQQSTIQNREIHAPPRNILRKYWKSTPSGIVMETSRPNRYNRTSKKTSAITRICKQIKKFMSNNRSNENRIMPKSQYYHGKETQKIEHLGIKNNIRI